MKKKKEFNPTNSAQEAAVDIMMEFIFLEDFSKETIYKILDKIEAKYQLCEDPFTRLPCTTKEYFKNSEEYNRQLMEEKYGYWED